MSHYGSVFLHLLLTRSQMWMLAECIFVHFRSFISCRKSFPSQHATLASFAAVYVSVSNDLSPRKHLTLLPFPTWLICISSEQCLFCRRWIVLTEHLKIGVKMGLNIYLRCWSRCYVLTDVLQQHSDRLIQAAQAPAGLLLHHQCHHLWFDQDYSVQEPCYRRLPRLPTRRSYCCLSGKDQASFPLVQKVSTFCVGCQWMSLKNE